MRKKLFRGIRMLFGMVLMILGTAILVVLMDADFMSFVRLTYMPCLRFPAVQLLSAFAAGVIATIGFSVLYQKKN